MPPGLALIASGLSVRAVSSNRCSSKENDSTGMYKTAGVTCGRLGILASFSMIARRCPWSCVRMLFSSVVLPEPRKPVMTCRLIHA